MKKYCVSCKKEIRGDGVDLSLIDNPLVNGDMHQSCFLVMLYEMLDELKLNVHSIASKMGIEELKKQD